MATKFLRPKLFQNTEWRRPTTIITDQKFRSTLSELNSRQIKVEVHLTFGDHLNFSSNAEQFHTKPVYNKVKLSDKV